MEQASFNFMAAFPLFPCLFAMKWWDHMPWSSFFECWSLSQLFHSPLSLSSRSSLVLLCFVIMVLSSAYLRLLIFLPEILIPACASYSLAFRMMYSVYKLNKQSDNVQPWCTLFPIWTHSVVPCSVLTVASLPAYRFFRRKLGKAVWYSNLFKNFPQFAVIHIGEGFGIVNKAEVDVPLELSPFFYDPQMLAI